MRFSFIPYRNGRHGFVTGVIDRLGPVKLLDVGNLGDGESTNLLLKKEVEARGGTYCGLDSNEPLTRKLSLPNQKIGDLHAAPFGDGEFDVIYAGEILEHTWTPSLMVSECYRILKPGGLLVLDTPNPFCISRILLFFLRKQDSMRDERTLTYHEAKDRFGQLKGRGEVLLQPQHKLFYTPAMLKQLCDTHGFALESIGTTIKPRSVIEKILLWMFPHGGQHLCIIARKADLEETFQDIRKNQKNGESTPETSMKSEERMTRSS